MKTVLINILLVLHGSMSSPTPNFYTYYDTPRVTSYEYVIPYQPPTFYNNLPVLPPPDIVPSLNILAEAPSFISNSFTVVPLVVVAKENMNMIKGGQIMKVSKDKPEMTMKVQNSYFQATPAVRIVLDTPMVIYSVRSEILFPSRVEIVHQGYRLPIKIGTVVAPVAYDTFAATSGPISLTEVYAIPSEPLHIDYVNNDKGVVIKPEDDAVVIENTPESNLPPKNVTVLVFPGAESEPIVNQHDEEDDELDNRFPPVLLAPGGISQSIQPSIIEQVFSNPKESSVLTQLREEAYKRQ